MKESNAGICDEAASIDWQWKDQITYTTQRLETVKGTNVLTKLIHHPHSAHGLILPGQIGAVEAQHLPCGRSWGGAELRGCYRAIGKLSCSDATIGNPQRRGCCSIAGQSSVMGNGLEGRGRGLGRPLSRRGNRNQVKSNAGAKARQD